MMVIVLFIRLYRIYLLEYMVFCIYKDYFLIEDSLIITLVSNSIVLGVKGIPSL
jgi:hypothetical protein